MGKYNVGDIVEVSIKGEEVATRRFFVAVPDDLGKTEAEFLVDLSPLEGFDGIFDIKVVDNEEEIAAKVVSHVDKLLPSKPGLYIDNSYTPEEGEEPDLFTLNEDGSWETPVGHQEAIDNWLLAVTKVDLQELDPEPEA